LDEIHPLTGAGVILTVAGPWDPNQILPIVGPVLTIAGLLLDWLLRRQTRRELDIRFRSLAELEGRLRLLQERQERLRQSEDGHVHY
jgi:hypothetical protein